MMNMLTRLSYLLCAAQLLLSCSVLQPGGADTGLASIQNEHIRTARFAVQNLDEVDALIRLDNHWLSDQIKNGTEAQLESFESINLQKIKISFSRQYIALEAIVDILDKNNNSINASVSGDISLDINASEIAWIPRFRQLRVNSADFTFDDINYVEATTDLCQSLLQRLNVEISEALLKTGNNKIAMNVVPLGDVQVGASLPGFSTQAARHTQALEGVFLLADSAVLIDSSRTTIALNMSYIPGLSSCPADIVVSRAEFARDIQSREPVGIVENLGHAADVGFFFSEITGAKQPLTIIHYWFADGSPMALEELAVEPSERWRTWSAKGPSDTDAKRWEVLVVDKQSRCIVHSKAIQKLAAEKVLEQVSPAQARQAFAQFKEEFRQKVAGFSIIEDKPDIALIEVNRPFLRAVLQDSLADLNIDVEFASSALPALQFSANLHPFDTDDIVCQQRSCAPIAACRININHCKRLRDTRDCSSCLFRNPLNNRCLSEATDPLCEASRDRQNARYDADRESCISNAESAKRECDLLNEQANRSCQIESEFEDSACESVKNSIKSLRANTPLAHVSAQTHSSGKLTANFSNFHIEGDLDSLKLDMTLNSKLLLAGELKFSPAKVSRSLTSCIANWSAPFSSSFANTAAVSMLFSDLEENQSSLTANWSGFGLNTEMIPSPFESVFGANPQRLAACGIGLTADKVEQSIEDDDSGFFQGSFDLQIQPLPTRIHLAPATFMVGEQTYSAEAFLSGSSLRYSIED